MKLSEQELIEKVSRKTLLREEAVRKILEALKETIEEEVLREGKKITLWRFGVFKPALREIDGKRIKYISFSTSKVIKDWYREYV